MAEIVDQLYEPKARSGVDLLNYPMRLSAQIAYLAENAKFFGLEYFNELDRRQGANPGDDAVERAAGRAVRLARDAAGFERLPSGFDAELDRVADVAQALGAAPAAQRWPARHPPGLPPPASGQSDPR